MLLILRTAPEDPTGVTDGWITLTTEEGTFGNAYNTCENLVRYVCLGTEMLMNIAPSAAMP